MEILVEILLLIASYLLGSVPNALIISKVCKGIDIREYGSKNMGATNVLRVLGLKYGLIVFILDALKASVIIILFKVGIFSLDKYCHFPLLTYGLMAVIGHLFPIFANFKGGKGVACSAGIICSYAPLIAIPTLLAFLITVLITKYVSLSSIMAVTTALVFSFVTPLLMHQPFDWILIGVVIIIWFVFIFTHRENIKRLFKGEESKINLNKK
ncbi:MAG: glycerol-3-phosphate 1-O-acyltransferase PlsY [Bacilli bacterium]|nr:glycerol-3-phosphate 1-O-acyltransferase PlsY [Bacilli bacterium]